MDNATNAIILIIIILFVSQTLCGENSDWLFGACNPGTKAEDETIITYLLQAR